MGIMLEGFNYTPWDVELWNIKDWRRTEPVAGVEGERLNRGSRLSLG